MNGVVLLEKDIFVPTEVAGTYLLRRTLVII